MLMIPFRKLIHLKVKKMQVDDDFVYDMKMRFGISVFCFPLFLFS